MVVYSISKNETEINKFKLKIVFEESHVWWISHGSFIESDLMLWSAGCLKNIQIVEQTKVTAYGWSNCYFELSGHMDTFWTLPSKDTLWLNLCSNLLAPRKSKLRSYLYASQQLGYTFCSSKQMMTLIWNLFNTMTEKLVNCILINMISYGSHTQEDSIQSIIIIIMYILPRVFYPEYVE